MIRQTISDQTVLIAFIQALDPTRISDVEAAQKIVDRVQENIGELQRQKETADKCDSSAVIFQPQ